MTAPGAGRPGSAPRRDRRAINRRQGYFPAGPRETRFFFFQRRDAHDDRPGASARTFLEWTAGAVEVDAQPCRM